MKPNTLPTDSQLGGTLTTSFSINADFDAALARGRTHTLDGEGHLIGGGFLRRRRAHSCIGEPGAGKTLLLGHEALCLHTGEAFFGRPVLRCRSVFFACEAASSTLDRLVYGARLRGLAWPIKGLFVVPMAMDLKRDADRQRVTSIIAQARADVFFIDTANASGSGAEDYHDMPLYTAAINRIISDTGAAAVINHHTPISNGGRERGHTSFRGMLDLSIVVSEDALGNRTIEFGKARDAATNAFGQFAIKGAELGKTNLGEPFSVPYLVELETVARAEPKKRKATVAEEVLALVQRIAKAGQASGQVVRDEFFGTRPGQDRDNSKRSFNRAIASLQAAGKIELSGDFVVLRKP